MKFQIVTRCRPRVTLREVSNAKTATKAAQIIADARQLFVAVVNSETGRALATAEPRGYVCEPHCLYRARQNLAYMTRRQARENEEQFRRYQRACGRTLGIAMRAFAKLLREFEPDFSGIVKAGNEIRAKFKSRPSAHLATASWFSHPHGVVTVARCYRSGWKTPLGWMRGAWTVRVDYSNPGLSLPGATVHTNYGAELMASN